jgi:tetratricopeptide (TPR) repeat protein
VASGVAIGSSDIPGASDGKASTVSGCGSSPSAVGQLGAEAGIDVAEGIDSASVGPSTANSSSNPGGGAGVADDAVPEDLVGQSKLDLGDIYLFKNEPWESTLLYSQVEKTQKETPLAYEAKLKNAKLHYYMGNFKLAQEHLDVLKLATTREISNDAIALSAYIKDNTILDTSDVVMKQFASIELLAYQNQFDTAIASLQQLISAHPYHEVVDEAYWMMAKAYYQTGQYSEAANAYTAIHEKFAEDILADDALFELASIYENQLNDREKAMDTYQRLLAEFPGSKFAAEARKRFRKMRGDQL